MEEVVSDKEEVISWGSLPREVKFRIFNELDWKNLGTVTLVNRESRDIARSVMRSKTIASNAKNDRQEKLFTAFRDKNLESLTAVLSDSNFIPADLDLKADCDPHFRWLLHKWLAEFPEGVEALLDYFERMDILSEHQKVLFPPLMRKERFFEFHGLLYANAHLIKINSFRPVGFFDPLLFNSLASDAFSFSELICDVMLNHSNRAMTNHERLEWVIRTFGPYARLYHQPAPVHAYDISNRVMALHREGAQDPEGFALELAVKYGHRQAVRDLCGPGRLIGMDLERIKILIKNGASVVSLLEAAIAKQRPDVVKYLVEDERVLIRGSTWFSLRHSPLEKACYSGQIDSAILLLKNGASAKEYVYGLMHLYTSRKKFIKHGTPLMYACTHGHMELAAELRKNGARLRNLLFTPQKFAELPAELRNTLMTGILTEIMEEKGNNGIAVRLQQGQLSILDKAALRLGQFFGTDLGKLYQLTNARLIESLQVSTLPLPIVYKDDVETLLLIDEDNSSDEKERIVEVVEVSPSTIRKLGH